MASAECPSDDEDLEECEPGTGGSAVTKIYWREVGGEGVQCSSFLKALHFFSPNCRHNELNSVSHH